MSDKKKDKKKTAPVEKHNTAAWADSEQLKDISQVNIPSEADVLNAKEYVDSKQK